MSITVFLVRHAKHSLLDHVLVGRMANVHLSCEGRREAMGLAGWFAGQGVAVVQSSPRCRARQTAEPVAAAAGVPVEIVPALDEIDVGQWTGASFEELALDPRWRTWNAKRSTARPPGGESMIEVQSRMMDHIGHLGRALGSGSAVLVSHGDVIKAALLHIRGQPVDAYGAIEVAPASVSTIAIDASGPTLVAVNERRVP